MINKARYFPTILQNLTAIQRKYRYDTDHRFMVIPAGRRSRKTLIAKSKVLEYAIEHPGVKLFHAAPTNQQAKYIFWEGLKKYTTHLRKDKSETDMLIRLKNDTDIQVVGLDKPERIEGQTDKPIKGIHITEYPNVKASAWMENIRPILSDTNGFAILDGVPEGRNHYYERALYASGGTIPSTEPILGAYGFNPEDPDWCLYTWYSSDVLNPAEIEAVKRELDERTFRQEYEGSFETIEGLAYYNFSKDNYDLQEYEPVETVHIGMDFNVNPMTAAFCHVYSDEVHQFGEAYLKNSNTYKMGQHISDLFNPQNVIIYPDSTGKARESNATHSDLEILRRMGFTIKARQVNPRVKDRINAVNSKMKSMSGIVTYFINPKNCPKTISDFNKVERLMDGSENKKQEKEGLVHISSALGYLISYLYPIRKQKEWYLQSA